jgi:hypothetical protein
MPFELAASMLPGGAQPLETFNASTGGNIFRRDPSGKVVEVPGHKWNARTLRAISSDDCSHEIVPSALLSFPV